MVRMSYPASRRWVERHTAACTARCKTSLCLWCRPDAACARVTRQPGCRKDILPHPLVMGIEVLALERVREIHVVTAGCEILGVGDVGRPVDAAVRRL